MRKKIWEMVNRRKIATKRKNIMDFRKIIIMKMMKIMMKKIIMKKMMIIIVKIVNKILWTKRKTTNLRKRRKGKIYPIMTRDKPNRKNRLMSLKINKIPQIKLSRNIKLTIIIVIKIALILKIKIVMAILSHSNKVILF